MNPLRIAPVLLACLACSPPDVEPPTEAAPSVGTQAMAGTARPTMADSLRAYAAGAERDAVVAVVDQLFEALRTGDEALLRRVLDPTVVMHFAEVREGRTTYGSSTIDALAERIASAEAPLIERMWDPIVLRNGPLATLWAPYDFYVGASFSHCGVDTVHLMRTDSGWRIVGLAWTRMQPPDCPLHPGGPPS